MKPNKTKLTPLIPQAVRIKRIQKGVSEHIAQMKAYESSDSIICPVCHKSNNVEYRYDDEASSMSCQCFEFWCGCGASWYSYFTFENIGKIYHADREYEMCDNTIIDERGNA